MKYTKIISLICLLGILPAIAQEEFEKEEVNTPHSLSFVVGYTHIPEATKHGKTEEAVFVPTLGLDYLYEFREKWFVGAAFDIELGKYEVDFEEEEITREIAAVFAGLGTKYCRVGPF